VQATPVGYQIKVDNAGSRKRRLILVFREETNSRRNNCMRLTSKADSRKKRELKIMMQVL
jgi:hypothetical protein